MKKSIAAVLCILFVISLIGTSLGGYYLGAYKKGEQIFDKPDDCILYFFDELQKGNVEKMLSAFSTSFSGANFDFKGYSERMNTVYFGMLPNNDEFFQELNKSEVKGRASAYIKGFIISLLLDKDLEDYPRVSIDSTDEIDEIADQFDISRMEDIEVIEIGKIKLDNEQAIENNERIASLYGHEFLEEYLVAFEFEKDMYVVGMSLFEDNEKYSIYGLSAMLMNTSSIGFARPMKKRTLIDLYGDDSDVYSMEIIYEN